MPIFETQEQTNEFLCQCFTNSLTFGDGADNSCVDGVAGNVCVNTNEDVIGCFSYENMLTDTDEMLVGGPSEITLT